MIHKILKIDFNNIPELEYERLEEAMVLQEYDVKFSFVAHISFPGAMLYLFKRDDGAYSSSSTYTKENTPELYKVIQYALNQDCQYIHFHIDGVLLKKYDKSFNEYNWHDYEQH